MKTVAKLREDTGKPDGGYYSRSRSQESGGNRNGGLERYLGNRIDMKWRFIFIWASKERKMPRMACRQHDPNTDSNRIHTQSLWPILTLLSGARKQGDGWWWGGWERSLDPEAAILDTASTGLSQEMLRRGQFPSGLPTHARPNIWHPC